MRDQSTADIDLSLSGGGIRASLFSLGVVLYLIESRLYERVASIQSVSGGSITNAALAACPENSDPLEVCHSLAHSLAKRGSFFFPPRRALIAGAMIVLSYPIVLIITLTWINSTVHLEDVAVAIVPVGALVLGSLFFWLVALRILPRRLIQLGVYARLLTSVTARHRGSSSWSFLSLLPGGGRLSSPRMRDLPASRITHILCATELNSGRPIFFSKDWSISPRYGQGPANLRLAEAVYASAAFPGVFPPHVTRMGRFQWEGGETTKHPRQLVLVDGGVYNNLANEFANTLHEFHNKYESLDACGGCRGALQVLVNASAPTRPIELPRMVFRRSIMSFLRIMSILSRNTVQPRLEAIRTSHGSAEILILDVAQSPQDLANEIAIAAKKAHRSEEYRRAVAIRDLLQPGGTEYWDDFVSDTSLIRTTLSAVGFEKASMLLHHGFLSAAVAFSARLDYPGIEICPSRRSFGLWVEAVNASAVDLTRVRKADACQISEDVRPAKDRNRTVGRQQDQQMTTLHGSEGSDDEPAAARQLPP